ncbi:MAG TPA: YncE family protein, partial [Polyangium sp.]|nr:YncE family protein [Polyangium sp.]
MKTALVGVAVVVLPFMGGACSPGDPTVIYEYDAFQGDAYPNRRTPLVIPDSGALFITNSYADSVSVVDAVSGDTLGTYPVGRDPVSLDGPHHVVPSKAGDAVYIALSYPPENTGEGPHASHGSSVKSGYAQKLDMHDFRVLGQTRVDNNPGEIVLSDDGKRAMTSHFDLIRAQKNPNDIEAARATIAVVDTSTMVLVDSPAPKRITTCVAPHGMVLSKPDGATAYVACYGEDVVAIVDVESGTVN